MSRNVVEPRSLHWFGREHVEITLGRRRPQAIKTIDHRDVRLEQRTVARPSGEMKRRHFTVAEKLRKAGDPGHERLQPLPVLCLRLEGGHMRHTAAVEGRPPRSALKPSADVQHLHESAVPAASVGQEAKTSAVPQVGPIARAEARRVKSVSLATYVRSPR